MTAFRFVTLTCDGCGEIWDADDTELIRTARRMAAQGFWTFKDRKDFCPVCSGTHTRTDYGYYLIRKE